MAALSDEDRADLVAEFCRELSAERDIISGVIKADVRAAINGADQYLTDNAAAMNTAIPQPARGALTASQKARLYMHVIRKRFIKGA